MSVDIVGMQCGSPGLASGNPPRAVTNLLVFFGGYDQSLAMIAGTPLTRNDSNGQERTSHSAYRTLKEYFSSPSKSKAMDPDLSNHNYNTAVKTGMQFIRDHFDPLGRLVIYGFSAGGFLALRLCERISWHYGWYDFVTNSIPLNFTPVPNDSRFGRIRVDLLMTVDPCMEDSPDLHPATRTPEVVRHHENFWQHQPQPRDPQHHHYWGVFLPGAHDNPDEHPQVRPGQGWHDQMPIHTLPRVRRLIENDLSLQGTCFASQPLLRAAG